MELSKRTELSSESTETNIYPIVAITKIFRYPRSVERCQAEITNEFERKVTRRETRLSLTLHASIHAKNQYATLPAAVSAARAWKPISDPPRVVFGWQYMYDILPGKAPAGSISRLRARRKQAEPTADPPLGAIGI